MKKKGLMLLAINALVLGLLASGLQAKEDNLAMVYFIKAKAGHEGDLREALGAYAQWRKEAGDPWTWHVHEIVVGEDLGTYVIRSGNHTWGDFDAYQEHGRKFTEKWEEDVAKYVAKEHNMVTALDKDINRWPEDHGTVKVLSVVKYEIKPGKARQFKQSMKTIHETVVEEDYPMEYVLESVMSGTTGNVSYLIFPYSDFAGMDQPEEEFWEFMARVHGEEQLGKLVGSLTGSVVTTETFMLRLNWDLSIVHEK